MTRKKNRQVRVSPKFMELFEDSKEKTMPTFTDKLADMLTEEKFDKKPRRKQFRGLL